MPWNPQIQYHGDQYLYGGLQNLGQGVGEAIQGVRQAQQEQAADDTILKFADQQGLVTPDMHNDYLTGNQKQKAGIIAGITRGFAMKQQQAQMAAQEEQRQAMAAYRNAEAARQQALTTPHAFSADQDKAIQDYGYKPVFTPGKGWEYLPQIGNDKSNNFTQPTAGVPVMNPLTGQPMGFTVKTSNNAAMFQPIGGSASMQNVQRQKANDTVNRARFASKQIEDEFSKYQIPSPSMVNDVSRLNGGIGFGDKFNNNKMTPDQIKNPPVTRVMTGFNPQGGAPMYSYLSKPDLTRLQTLAGSHKKLQDQISSGLNTIETTPLPPDPNAPQVGAQGGQTTANYGARPDVVQGGVTFTYDPQQQQYEFLRRNEMAAFDPSKPYQIVPAASQAPLAFDPNKPYTIVPQATPSELPNVTGSEGQSLGRALAIGGATGVRLASGLATVPLEALDVIPGAGTAARAGIGAALGGGADLAAQGIERLAGIRDQFSMPEAGVAAGLQAIPLGEFPRMGMAARTGIRALEGAGLGAAGSQATSLLETGQPSSLANTVQGAAFGGAFGAGGEQAGRLLGTIPKFDPSQPFEYVPPTGEMPGQSGFTTSAGTAPQAMPEAPIAPAYQPVQPGAPIPYGPEAQPYQQPAPPAGQIAPTAMWPLSGQIPKEDIPYAGPPTSDALVDQVNAGLAANEVPPEVRQAQREAAAQAVSPTKTVGEFNYRYSSVDSGAERLVTVRDKTGKVIGQRDPFYPQGIPVNDAARASRIKQVAQEIINEAQRPKLRPKEQGTGELLQGSDQPFNLAGETDRNLKTAAEEAQSKLDAIAKAKADAEAEAAQMTMLGAEVTPADLEEMRKEAEADAVAHNEEHAAMGGQELADLIKQYKLQLPSEMKNYRGEFEGIRSMFKKQGKGRTVEKYDKETGKVTKVHKGGNTGFTRLQTGTGENIAYNDVFKKGGLTPDQFTDLLRSKGFPVDGIGDAADLVQQRFMHGKKIFGNEHLAEELSNQSFGRGRIDRAGQEGAVPQPGPSRVLPEGAVKARFMDRYRSVYRINKQAGDDMHALASSRGAASLKADTEWGKVVGNLTPTEAADLGRLIVSDNLRTVNPDHPDILNPIERARIERNANIARARSRYRQNAEREIKALHQQAGLQNISQAREGLPYAPLIPKTEEMLSDIQTPVGGVPLKFRSKTTRFAQHAEGNALHYETDLRKIMQTAYTEVTQKARLRDLYDTLVKNNLVSKEKVDEIKGQPASIIDIGGAAAGEKSSALPDKVFMPTQIAAAIEDIMSIPRHLDSPVRELGRAAQRAVTGAALTANPAELVNHMRRQFDLVAAMPAGNVPIGQRLAEAAVPYFGPRLGLAMRTFSDNMSSPENRAILQDIYDANAGSDRAFKEFQAKGWISRHTGLDKLQAFTQNTLFGVPQGRGVQGWDLRMRVQMEKIRRAIEGNVDPQRIRDFSYQIGQYTGKTDKLVEMVKYLNPYAATTLPVRATELRQLLGGSGLKAGSFAGAAGLRAETFLRGAGGTVIALAVANHLLSGHWPWENKPGHEFDLETNMTDSTGKPIYVKNRFVSPTVSRPIQTVSLPEFMRERASPSKEKSYVAAGMIGPANQAANILGSPLLNATTAAAWGVAPYLTRVPGTNKPPAPYDIVASQHRWGSTNPSDHGFTGDRGVDQVIAALQNLNPVGRSFEDQSQQLPPELQYIQRPIPGVEPFGRIFTTSYEHKAATKPLTPQQMMQRALHPRKK